MGLFDMVGNLASASIKVCTTPIAIVADVVNVATGNEPDSTKKLIKSAGKDLENIGEDFA